MTTFYNETSLNGKYQVMSTENLGGKGIRKIGDNYITEQKGKLYKNLKNYWVSKSALEAIKEYANTERVCF